MNDDEKKKNYNQNHCLISGCRLHGRYVTKRVLGEGGFGITYEGWDESLNIQIAIKEYFPVGKVYRHRETNEVIAFNQECARDFKRGLDRYVKEADILSKFYQEEGIVSVRDFFQENHTAYIIMEYLDGITLRDFVKTNGKLSIDDVREIIQPIVKAMGLVHGEGILHRDISPDNIMVTLDDKVKLIDFGSARDFCYEPEKTATVTLRQGFAPIEQYQAHGEQGTWTDVYALCGTIYYLLTAKEPPDTMERIIVDRLKPVSDYGVLLPKWQEKAVMDGLGIYRDHRYNTMEEMWTQIFEPNRNFQWYFQMMYRNYEKMWKRAGMFLAAAGVVAVIWSGSIYGLSYSNQRSHAVAPEQSVGMSVPSPDTVTEEPDTTTTGQIVPGVEGLKLSDAKKRLKNCGLSWKVRRRYHDRLPRGMVISQSAGILEDPDGTTYIKLIVSKGKKPAATMVPTQTPSTEASSTQKMNKATKTQQDKKKNSGNDFQIDSGESQDFVPEQ